MLHRARFFKVGLSKKDFCSTFCSCYAYNSTTLNPIPSARALYINVIVYHVAKPGGNGVKLFTFVKSYTKL